MQRDKQKGFTLVEIVVTLILVGILASVAGMGIVQATRSYLFTQEASAMSQKAQAAYARLGRTFVNISDVDFTGISNPSKEIKVTLERMGAEVEETYLFSENFLSLTIGSQTNRIIDGLDSATSFFSYFKNDGTAWGTSDDETDLSRIQVNIALNSTGGQTVGFPATFVPRNIYRPVEVSDFNSGSGSVLPDISACFISSIYSPVDNWEWSETFGRWIPAGVLISIGMALVYRRKIKMKRLSQKGSALVAVIITMIVMGILAAAMTSMFSTSSIGTVTPSLSNSAYYNAESAYRHVLYTFLNAPDGNKFQSIKDNIHGKTLVLSGNNKADLNIEAFWFVADGNQSNSPTLKVKTPVSFPQEFLNGTTPDSNFLPQSGYLAIEGDAVNNPIPYKKVIYNNDGSLTFTLDNTTCSVNDGDDVSPAFISSMTGTISEGGNISNISGGSLKSFPRKNGVISLSTNSGGTYVLYYEKVNSAKTGLINVKSASNFAALPSAGLQSYGGIDFISLQQNARIRVTGYGGDASGSLHAQRSIEYYQPLIEGTIVTKHEYTDKGDSLVNWKTGGDDEIGDHAIVKVDDDGNESDTGDNAIAVTDTDSINGPVSGINAAYYGKGVQESLLLYKPDVAGFKDIWNKSDEKLSYDVQCKVSFTEDNDHAEFNPQGTYMPGIVFRARESETYNNVREYYGLSFVRALFAKDSNDDPQVSNPDADDIPDQYLFENNGTNDSISASVAEDVCIVDYTPAPQWNDLPPLSGVPYMMLWQQSFDFDRYDGLWQRNSTLYLDWLSYVPLSKYESVSIYYYPAVSVAGQDLVPCEDCANCNPKTWYNCRRNKGWFPDCCVGREEIDNGWAGHGCVRWFKYKCTTYSCSDCPDETCCGSPTNYPEGWYLGPIPGDPRTPTIYQNSYKIEDHNEYGMILQHNTININANSFDIIGNIDKTVYLVRDPATFSQATGYRGDPIQNVAFVFPKESVAFQKEHNYRIYLKPWVTVMARIIEMKGDFFDEDGSGCGNSEDERINIIQAWFGEPSTYPRGQIRWPDENPASFSEMIWPDRGYTSKLDHFTAGSGWNTSEQSRRLCDRGEDQYTNTDEKRSPYVYSNQLTSAGYDNYSSDNQPAELGLHTFGIDASSTDPDHKDRVYFDDFSVRVFEYGQASGVLPGVQSE